MLMNCPALQGGDKKIILHIGFSQTVLWAKAHVIITNFIPALKGRAIEILNLMKLKQTFKQF
jgi:phosphoketolase